METLKIHPVSETKRVVVSRIAPLTSARSPKEYFEDATSTPDIHQYELQEKKSFFGVSYWSTIYTKRDVVARRQMPNYAGNIDRILSVALPVSSHQIASL